MVSISEPPALVQLRWQVGTLLHHRIGTGASPTGSLEQEVVPGRTPRTDRPPMGLHPTNSAPVLTAADVTDYGRSNGVGDPFLLITDSWHLFFEVYNRTRTPTAVIGHATSTNKGRTWSYDRVVLRTDRHLSFPFVFEHNDAYYMIPDAWSKSGAPAPTHLYRTDDVPSGWRAVATLLRPEKPLHDCVVFRHGGRWWAVAGNGRDLHIYHSPRLVADDWTPHEANPVVEDRPQSARPGGRPFVTGDRVFLYLQDCSAQYGKQLRLYEVETLDPAVYDDREVQASPVLTPGPKLLGWNAGKMHHIDYQFVDGRWRCVVDGNIGVGRMLFGNNWSIGLYESGRRTTG